MKTLLFSPAYDKEVSYSMCSHGWVQFSSHSSFSSDTANVSKYRKIVGFLDVLINEQIAIMGHKIENGLLKNPETRKRV